MGSEKENNKKVGWECDNNSHGHGTVCKPICGPGAFPTGTNNVCVCDKKNECKWKGYIKDHCQRKSHQGSADLTQSILGLSCPRTKPDLDQEKLTF